MQWWVMSPRFYEQASRAECHSMQLCFLWRLTRQNRCYLSRQERRVLSLDVFKWPLESLQAMKGHVSRQLPVAVGEPVLPHQPHARSVWGELTPWQGRHAADGSFSTLCQLLSVSCFGSLIFVQWLFLGIRGNFHGRSITIINLELVTKLWSFSSWDCPWLASFLCASSFPSAGSCFGNDLDSLVMSPSDCKNFAELPCDSLPSCCLWHFSFSRPTPA